MLIFDRIIDITFFTIHTFTDKKIRILGISDNAVRRSGICCIGHFQSFSCRPQNKFRKVHTSVRLYCLTLLQPAPEPHRNVILFRLVNLKHTCTLNRYTISIACDAVVNFKCIYHISVKTDLLLRLRQLDKLNFKWQFRSDHSQCFYNTLQTLWPDHGQRFCSVRITHSQQDTRQAADMISVEMGNADNINRSEAPSLFSNSNLCTFPAIN